MNFRFFFMVSFGISLIFVLKSNPFLKLPYDVWHHLMLMRGLFETGQPEVTMPHTSRHEVVWHFLWAHLFHFLNIDDVFFWAKIIHVSQFLWAFFSIFFFTFTTLLIFYKNKDKFLLRIGALISSWAFILGASTFSVQYQLSWVLWYSVNYQGFSLPSYFFVLAIFFIA